MEKEQVYFTLINKEGGKLEGYKLQKDLRAEKVWSFNMEKSGEKIFKVKT